MIPTIAPLSQLITGLRVADGVSTACDSCGCSLQEGQRIHCRIERNTTTSTWEITEHNCTDCSGTKPLGTSAAAIVVGRLGTVRDVQTQSSWLLLLDAEPIGANLSWIDT